MHWILIFAANRRPDTLLSAANVFHEQSVQTRCTCVPVDANQRVKTPDTVHSDREIN